MIAQRTEAERARAVADNFIKLRGRQKFLRLIEMLQANVPGPKIAHEFGVKRQRVHQWKIQLGHRAVTFHLHPEIENMLGITSAGRKTV